MWAAPRRPDRGCPGGMHPRGAAVDWFARKSLVRRATFSMDAGALQRKGYNVIASARARCRRGTAVEGKVAGGEWSLWLSIEVVVPTVCWIETIDSHVRYVL
jgi:hypothetical protein